MIAAWGITWTPFEKDCFLRGRPSLPRFHVRVVVVVVVLVFFSGGGSRLLPLLGWLGKSLTVRLRNLGKKKQLNFAFSPLNKRQGFAILNPTRWLKYCTRWILSLYDFRMGCVTHLLQQGGSNKKSLFHDNPQQQQQRHEPGSLLDQSADAAGKKEK